VNGIIKYYPLLISNAAHTILIHLSRDGINQLLWHHLALFIFSLMVYNLLQ